MTPRCCCWTVGCGSPDAVPKPGTGALAASAPLQYRPLPKSALASADVAPPGLRLFRSQPNGWKHMKCSIGRMQLSVGAAQECALTSLPAADSPHRPLSGGARFGFRRATVDLGCRHAGPCAAAVRRSTNTRACLAIHDADFGFASFSHIVQLAPDLINLDLDMVRGVDLDPVSRRCLATAVVVFAARTGAQVLLSCRYLNPWLISGCKSARCSSTCDSCVRFGQMWAHRLARRQ